MKTYLLSQFLIKEADIFCRGIVELSSQLQQFIELNQSYIIISVRFYSKCRKSLEFQAKDEVPTFNGFVVRKYY